MGVLPHNVFRKVGLKISEWSAARAGLLSGTCVASVALGMAV